MTGSEADSEREVEEEASTADSPNLAQFLTPVPRARSSWPAQPNPPAEEKPAIRVEDADRAGLFSERPIPRRNSSLLPPPGDAAPTPRPGDFGEQESPTGSLSVEKNAGDETMEGDVDDLEVDNLDVVPGAGFSLGSDRVRRVAILVGAAAIAIAVVSMVRRMAGPSKALPSAAASVDARRAEGSNAPTNDTLEPTDDFDRDPSGADPAMGRELRREAKRLLQASQAEEGVAVARRAIAADPDAPEGYILLAAGLQDLGRWQESRDVFAKCVHDSNGKTNAECVYFATRSK